MAVRQFVLTFDGTIQRLSTVLGVTTVGGIDDIGFYQLILAADPANAAVCYIGDDGVSATDHGFSLDPTQATAVDKVSLGPFELPRLKLSQLYALGTATQRLMILGIY